jgi:hypothetical protein
VSYRELYVAQETMHDVVNAAVRRARVRVMLQEAGIETQGAVSRLGRRLLAQARHRLAGGSERPKRDGVSPALPLGRQASSGR